jgi:hypothetical protein
MNVLNINCGFLVPSLGTIQCYSGSGDSEEDWEEKTCWFHDFCVKVDIVGLELRRGCPLPGATLLIEKEGCTFLERTRTHSCSCQTDLCNTGSNIKTQNYKFLFLFVILITALLHLS